MMSEIEMHYGECLLWVDALEWFIRRQGVKVPTWSEIERAGWRPTVTPPIKSIDNERKDS